MKKLNSLFVMLLFMATTAFAQFPQAINFQAIARDGNGDVMVATPIQIRLTVLDGSATGTEVYQELRALTTNDYGSFSFQIGRNANYVTIGSFGAIDWNTGAKYLKIDYDPTNQFNWSLSLGTIEFAAVPYAFSAENVTFIDATGAQDGDVLVYNATSGKFEPGSVNATELDPIFNASAAKNITSGNITNWNTAYGWGNHATAGYMTTEVDGSVTNEIELPTQTGNSGKVLSTNGTAASWTTVADNSATNEIQNLGSVLNQGTDAGAKNITNLANPVNAQDASTKGYVDLLEIRVSEIEEQLYLSGALKLKDYDGNEYSVVKIGTQLWMAENLKTTHYNDGTPIPVAFSYWHNVENVSTYGRLYNWDSAMKGETNENAQGVCPIGWHIPSDSDWQSLINYLGGADVAGGKMKETGTAHWTSPNTGGTNESGFTALPGGNWDGPGGAGDFYDMNNLSIWWSSTEISSTSASYYTIYYNSASISNGASWYKLYGYSIRCIKD